MTKTPKIPEIQVSASILCADFARLGEEIRMCEASGIDLVHVDVMDGHFVPNITIGPLIVKALRPLTKIPIEAHLMIENPWLYIDDFLAAGADAIFLQAECYGPRKEGCRQFGQYPKEVESIEPEKLRPDLRRIRKAGKKVFMVLNPGTPQCLAPVLDDIDGVLVMSVNPGFAKQQFMPQVLPKIRDLRSVFAGDIAVDGGINAATAPQVVRAGGNILATASYFFGAPDRRQAVQALKALPRACGDGIVILRGERER